MVEITQAQAQVVLDWDMAERQGFNQAIAALEQPTPELAYIEPKLSADQLRATLEARGLTITTLEKD